MRDQLLQNKEKQRGKKKDKVMAMTQGGMNEETPSSKSNVPSTPSTPSKVGGAGGNKGGKKKKGKK